MVVFLFYTEDESTGGNLSAARMVPVLDHFLRMYGGKAEGIHPEGADYSARVEATHPSLEAAQDVYSGYAWVYLDPKASVYLDEYEHPEDDVVYVVGHDSSGYGGSDLSNGTTVKLRTAAVGYAIPVLIATACDRWARMH